MRSRALRRACRARPRGAEGPAAVLRPRRRRSTCRATRCDLRGDRRCAAARRGGSSRALALSRPRRRRDRSRLPAETRFRHLEDSVRALKARGHRGQRRFARRDELLRGGRAGADYLLSLNVDTLWIADEVASTPVLIAREPSDQASLDAAIDAMQRRPALPRRSDPRSDSVRPRGLAGALPAAARALSRCPDHDGHRQPDRADRGRHERHQRGAVRHRRGAAAPRPC